MCLRHTQGCSFFEFVLCFWCCSFPFINVHCTYVVCVFYSSEPVQVVNVRVYVYHPLLNEDNITALIVWDALNATEAGGIVNHYDICIQDLQTDEVWVCKYK